LFFGAGYKYSSLLLTLLSNLYAILDRVLQQQKARFAHPYQLRLDFIFFAHLTAVYVGTCITNKTLIAKNSRQCTLLDVWLPKTSQHITQTVYMATKSSQKQEADDALKHIFGHETYKSEVQQKALSAILTGSQSHYQFED